MRTPIITLALVGLLGLTGCATKASTGALIGSGVGAGAGYMIGKKSGSGGKGAAIGAAVGAGGGYMIGNEADKRDAASQPAYEYGHEQHHPYHTHPNISDPNHAHPHQ